jgi:hypothetical protein
MLTRNIQVEAIRYEDCSNGSVSKKGMITDKVLPQMRARTPPYSTALLSAAWLPSRHSWLHDQREEAHQTMAPKQYSRKGTVMFESGFVCFGYASVVCEAKVEKYAAPKR